MKITTNADKIIAKLQNYRDSLNDKCILFAQKLLERGVKVANVRLQKGKADEDKTDDKPTVRIIEPTGQPAQGSLAIEGEGVLFWEFGAGNKLNPDENPMASKFGMGIGTYPGQTHVPDPGYWFYTGTDNKSHFSVGTKATMPAFMADVEMINSIEEVAREVFGNV